VGADTKVAELAGLYRETRERLTALVSGLDDAVLATPVPACPAWSVRDVLSHVAAIPQDALAGRLTGPPDEDETAAQVARLGGLDLAGILRLWQQHAPGFEDAVAALKVWPAVIDVASHEQDIRAALRQPGARDCAAIQRCSHKLLGWLDPPVPVRVSVEDAEYRIGPPGGAELKLTTTRYEAFRWRMGRRSRGQLAALDWSGDPAPVLGHLTVFGPAQRDIVE
jgi:uncharacterized protein (TIGR03083 family)